MSRLIRGLGIVGLTFTQTLIGQQSGPPAAKVYSAWPFDGKEAARRQDETAAAMGVKRELKPDVRPTAFLAALGLSPTVFVDPHCMCEPIIPLRVAQKK